MDAISGFSFNKSSLSTIQETGQQFQAPVPIKARPIPMHIITELSEREYKLRSLQQNLAQLETEKEDDDWDDDEDDEQGETNHLVAVWKELIAKGSALGSYDVTDPDVRNVYIPLEIFHRRVDTDDETQGLVFLQPVASEPACMEIVLFGVEAQKLRRDALHEALREASIFTQIRLEDAQQLPAGSTFEMVVRAHVPPASLESLGSALYQPAGFTLLPDDGVTPYRVFQLKKSFAKFDLSKLRLSYMLALRKRN